ncbi:MAG: HD domain-containing protein [Candidatus Omnitrophota bacterium]
MNFSLCLEKIPHLSLISEIAKKHNFNIWLVGGFLRDIYLNKSKEQPDFDFCVEKNAGLIAKEFAKKISSKVIVLDEGQQTLRVILKKNNKTYYYDFTLMRAQSLKQDLFLRDFTINSLALNIQDKNPQLIDYCGAKKDLDKGLIRLAKPEVIPHDPLRILRGFAFAVNYDFRIEDKTLKIMAKFKKLLKKVSKERINEELFKIFSSGHSYKAVIAMDKFKIIDEIIPYIDKSRGVNQGSFHHLDVWAHSIEALRQFELLYNKRLKKNKEIEAYLNEELAQNRRRIQIIKLACLLHDVGKPKAKKKLAKRTIFHTHEKIGRDLAGKAAQTLRLSSKEEDILKKLVFWHLRPGYLADQIKPTKRAVYRFFRDTQKEGAGVILLSLADWRATRGPGTDITKRKRHEKIMLNLVDLYLEQKKKKPLPKIVDGYGIMKKFKLKPGPLIGKILRKIKEEQALGKISTKTQAYDTANKIIIFEHSRIKVH